MLSQTTTVRLAGLSVEMVYDFMLSLDAATYRKWHREHNDFAMVSGRLDRVGSVMYFDEYLGKKRLKGNWTVIEVARGSRIIFKAHRFIPVYLELTARPSEGGVEIEHRLKVGYDIRILNLLISWLYFRTSLKKELERHVEEEFNALEQLLI